MHFTSVELLRMSADLTSPMQLSHRETEGVRRKKNRLERIWGRREEEWLPTRRTDRVERGEKVYEEDQNNEQEIWREKFKYDGKKKEEKEMKSKNLKRNEDKIR